MPEPSTMPPSTPRASRRLGLHVLWLLACAALGYGVWQQAQRLHVQERELKALAQALRAQSHGKLPARLEAVQEQLRGVQQRLTDVDAAHRSVREELLGMAQRAQMLQESVARIAERPLLGDANLHLNEAEYLLRLGQARLVLFQDPQATLYAYRLADAELAALNDPLLAGVRQTIASEVQAIQEVPALNQQQALQELDAISAQVAGWSPPTGMGEQTVTQAADLPASGFWARVTQMLGRYVRVRRADAHDAAWSDPFQSESARILILQELALAKVDLALGRFDAFRARLAHARSRIQTTHWHNVGAQQEVVARALVKLESEMGVRAWPAIDRSLSELRQWRSLRGLTTTPAAGAVGPAP